MPGVSAGPAFADLLGQTFGRGRMGERPRVRGLRGADDAAREVAVDYRQQAAWPAVELQDLPLLAIVEEAFLDVPDLDERHQVGLARAADEELVDGREQAAVGPAHSRTRRSMLRSRSPRVVSSRPAGSR